MSGHKGIINLSIFHPFVHPHIVIGLARNYKSLVGKPPYEDPIIFLKASTSIIGPGDNIVLTDNIPYAWPEVELAFTVGVIINKPISPEEAEQFIGPHRIANDVTAQFAPDVHLAKSKSVNTFCPVSKVWIQNFDLSDVRLYCMINGILVQDSRTSNRILNDAEALSYISNYMNILPGTLIITGTPKHEYPQLMDGDLVTVGIEGLGEMSNVVSRKS